jgi:hypothetical protein
VNSFRHLPIGKQPPVKIDYDAVTCGFARRTRSVNILTPCVADFRYPDELPRAVRGPADVVARETVDRTHIFTFLMRTNTSDRLSCDMNSRNSSAVAFPR